MTDKWVRVYEGMVPQARIAEGLLQENGVPAAVLRTPASYMNAASYGTSTHRESVLVPPDRAEEALRILRADHSGDVGVEAGES